MTARIALAFSAPLLCVALICATAPQTIRPADPNQVLSRAQLEKTEETLMTANNGIISKKSNHSVDETLEKLKTMLQAKGVAIFAIVDHSGEAEKVGLKMPPTKLVIFGSPKAGTPLMLAAPTVAIDLPLKILISEDDIGNSWVSYNSAEYLQQRHGIPSQLLQNIAVIETLARAVTE